MPIQNNNKTILNTVYKQINTRDCCSRNIFNKIDKKSQKEDRRTSKIHYIKITWTSN